ncbi:unnamed protein product, partial [Ectocarpus sp. 12 AP-2014]
VKSSVVVRFVSDFLRLLRPLIGRAVFRSQASSLCAADRYVPRTRCSRFLARLVCFLASPRARPVFGHQAHGRRWVRLLGWVRLRRPRVCVTSPSAELRFIIGRT